MSDTVVGVLLLVLAALVLFALLFAFVRFLFFPKRRTFSWPILAAMGVAFLGVGVFSYFAQFPDANVPTVGTNEPFGPKGIYAVKPGSPASEALDKLEVYAKRSLIFVVTLFAVIVAYMFSVQGKLKSSVPALQKLLPLRSDTFYNRVDFLLVAIAGSVIGFIFFGPATARQALSAGMGWVGAVNILSNGKSSK